MRSHRSTETCCFAAVVFVVASSLAAAAAIDAKHIVAVEITSSGPEGIPGLCLWFKADSISGLKNGEIVTRWNDSGPKGIHLDKPSGTPTFVANALGGRPAVRLREGQTDGMQTSAPVPTLARNPEFTIFLVASVAKPTAARTHPLGWASWKEFGETSIQRRRP